MLEAYTTAIGMFVFPTCHAVVLQCWTKGDEAEDRLFSLIRREWENYYFERPLCDVTKPYYQCASVWISG
jgi:hypothetical protein